MKKIIFFLSIVCSSAVANAQKDSTKQNTEKYETIPYFYIYTLPDSTLYTHKDLHKNQPLVIMFFSPDCEHCQKEMKELLAYKEELKHVQILMASPLNYSLVKQFYHDYDVAAMPNIKMGQDVNYALGKIYQLRTFPSIFVYNKSGKLTSSFVGNVAIPKILDALK